MFSIFCRRSVGTALQRSPVAEARTAHPRFVVDHRKPIDSPVPATLASCPPIDVLRGGGSRHRFHVVDNLEWDLANSESSLY